MARSITDFELRIMGALWQSEGGVTVQRIIDLLAADGKAERPGYTTVLKALQKLQAKGKVGYERLNGRAYLYFPLVDRVAATRSRLRELVDNVFAGDKSAFAHAFLSASKPSPEEIAELRSLILEFDASDEASDE